MSTEPIGLPADVTVPDDILSRGTVGPVTPPPVEAAPPAPPVATAPPVTPTVDPSLFTDPPREREEVGPRRGLRDDTPDPRLAQITEDISGIETMAPSIGMDDYSAPATTAPAPAAQPEADIPLPDGSSFNLSDFNLSDVDLSEFDSSGFTLGQMPPASVVDQFEAPLNADGGTPSFNLNDAISLGQDAGGFVEPTTGGYTPGINVPGVTATDPAPQLSGNTGGQPAGLPQGAVDEAQGTSPNFMSDFNLNDAVSLGQDAGGFVEPETGAYTPGVNVPGVTATDGAAFGNDFTFGGNNNFDFAGIGPDDLGISPNLDAGLTLGDSFLTEPGTGMADPYNPTFNDNPYPFIPEGIDTSGMTPEQLSGLNSFYESGGLGNIDSTGINIGGIPGYTGGPIIGGGSYTPGSGTGDGNYTVTPVGAVGDLDPQSYTGPMDVRSASSFGLTGAQPTVPANSTNPFRRPESQEGIGSLAGGG